MPPSRTRLQDLQVLELRTICFRCPGSAQREFQARLVDVFSIPLCEFLDVAALFVLIERAGSQGRCPPSGGLGGQLLAAVLERSCSPDPLCHRIEDVQFVGRSVLNEWPYRIPDLRAGSLGSDVRPDFPEKSLPVQSRMIEKIVFPPCSDV